MFVRSAYAD